MSKRFHRSPHLCTVVKFCSLLALCVPNLWCQSASAFLLEYYNDNNPQDFKHKPHPDQNITSDGVPSIYNASVVMFPNNPDNFQRIGRRVNDQMTDFLNHSVIVAHIANGIALQAGIMGKTISIEDVVSELLNLGPAGVNQIRNFQSDSVATLTSKLQGTAKQLNAGKDIIDAEQIAFKYNELCTTPLPGQNATEVLHNDKYFEELGAILKSSLVKNVNGYNNTLNSIEDALTKISGFSSDSINDPIEQRGVVNLFQNLPASFEYLFKYSGALKKDVEELKNKTAIYGAPLLSFDSLAMLVHLRNVRKNITDDIELSMKPLSENVKIVYQHMDDIETARNEVEKMQIVVGSRVHSVSTEKHYTSGFHFGIADVKQLETDVNDLWISKILNINQDDLHKLGVGLLPLITASVEIKSLDDKLLPVSNSTVYQSLLNIAKLHSEVSAITPHSFNMSEVIQKYTLCSRSTIYSSDTKPAEDLLKNVRLLKNSLDSMKEYVSKINVSEMKADFDKFHNTLAFKDLNNMTQSLIDLPTVISNLDKLALKSLKGRVSNAKQALNDATIPGIGALLNDINDGKGKIYRLEKTFDNELSILKCLKEIEKQSSNMTKVFHVIQNLRSLDKMLLADVERVAVSIAEVSKSLSSIEAIPAQMKENASIVTEKIIQLPESAKTSEIIGQSANSLRNAYELLNLESSIDLLKGIDRTVQKGISNISNTKDRKSVSEQWGKDYAKDMAQLDAALAAVKAFSNKLNTANAKTIGDYGVPLIELATIPDVNINATEKSKALETLIHLNPNDKSLLRSSKETLDVIASLDLQFSSHKAQLENAPTAFGAIHSFLSQILPNNHFAASMPATGVTEGIPYWVWIITAVLIVLLAVVFVGVACWLISMKKKKKEKEEKEKKEKEEKEKKEKEEKEKMEKIKEDFKNKLLNFIKKLAIDPHNKNSNCMDAITLKKREKGVSKGILKSEKHRYSDIPCNPVTSIDFQLDGKDFQIHANKVSASGLWSDDETRFIATQAPLPGTIVDFWSMVIKYECNIIVMLCNFMEDEICKADPYFAQKEGEEQEFGRFKIRTISVKKIINETTVERTLEVVDKENKHSTRHVKHYQFLVWKERGIPDGHENVSKLMEMVDKDKKPIVVHCSSGVGRTMAFIGMNVATQMVINRPDIEVKYIATRLRNQRWVCIQTPSQLQWLFLAIIYQLTKKYKLDTKEYDTQLKFFKENMAKFENARQEELEKKENEKTDRQAAGNECEEETSVEDVSTRNDKTIISIK